MAFCAVGFFGNFSPITRRFLDACENIGLPRELDLNTPKGTLGVAKVSLQKIRFKYLLSELSVCSSVSRVRLPRIHVCY